MVVQSQKSLESIYRTSIEIVVQSKYKEVLKEFVVGFEATTSKFERLTLHVIDGEEYGAPVINRFLKKAIANSAEIFGVFNDDLWFANGWLEDTVEKLRNRPYSCVSPGYAETDNKDNFVKVVEATKNEKGVVPLLYGPNALFLTAAFSFIGFFDERFTWSCDDLDLAWRLKLRGLHSATAKRVTVGHYVGSTRGKDLRGWYERSNVAKEAFYDKHGYRSYRELRMEYKIEHKYFAKFRKFKGKRTWLI